MSFTFWITWYEPTPPAQRTKGEPARLVARALPVHEHTFEAAVAARTHIRMHLDDWLPATAIRPDEPFSPLRPELSAISSPPPVRGAA